MIQNQTANPIYRPPQADGRPAHFLPAQTEPARVTMNLAQEQLAEMSDESIFQLCRKYGSQALFWRQKFIGLLPEVNRRRLYEKKGCSSIIEFAKKLAGLSEEQVRLTLNTEKRFEDKPLLRELLVNGEVSINKLARIVSIATSENQEILARQVKLLPIAALNTLVRDQKNASSPAGEIKDQNGLFETLFDSKSLYVHSNPQQGLELSNEGELKLDEDVKQKLLEIQRKGININELLREFLQNRELEIGREKEEIVADMRKQIGQTANMHGVPDAGRNTQGPGGIKKPSRYIPVKIKNLLKKEYGEKCAVPDCKKSKQTIHHTNRFALAGTHDPHYLAPLCKEHHLIAHSIDLKFHDARAKAQVLHQ
jgi:hypothetical protein